MTEAERRAVAILRSYGDRACYEEMVQTIVRGDAEILEARSWACSSGIRAWACTCWRAIRSA